MSRWENAPNLREVIRLMGVMIDLYCASYATPPVAVTPSISMTRSTWCTAINSCRCSTPITTNVIEVRQLDPTFAVFAKADNDLQCTERISAVLKEVIVSAQIVLAKRAAELPQYLRFNGGQRPISL